MIRMECSADNDAFRPTLCRCPRCGGRLGPTCVCAACQSRQMESARRRRILNWPEDPDPWQENAIRALEDQA